MIDNNQISLLRVLKIKQTFGAMKALKLLILTWVLLSCKKDAGIMPAELAGRWRMISRQVSENGIVEWKQIPESDTLYVFFSEYGEYVNSQGLLLPCGPAALKINGEVREIDFHSAPLITPYLGLCADCPTWDLELQSTQLIIQKCSPDAKVKLIRE